MYWMSRRLWMGEKADSFPIFEFYRCFFRPIQPDFSLFCKYLFCLAEETLKVCCLIFFSYWNHSGLRRFPAFQFFWTPGLEGCHRSGHHWRRIFLSAPGSQRISDGSVFDHSIGGFGDPFLPWNSVCFSWSVNTKPVLFFFGVAHNRSKPSSFQNLANRLFIINTHAVNDFLYQLFLLYPQSQ